MIVQSHMIDGPIYARPHEALATAYGRMQAHDVHHLPVVDEAQRVVGIVSAHDIAVPRYLDPGLGDGDRLEIAPGTTVAQAMTPDPLCLRPSHSLKEALDLFLDHPYAALPVVDEERRLVGMLSTKDLLLVLRDQLA